MIHDPIFVTVIVVAIFAAAVIRANFSDEARAKFIAANNWVIRKMDVGRDRVSIEIVALTGKRYIRFVGFGGSHPDFEAMQTLTEGDLVQFSYSDAPLKNVRPGAARHLRLENGGSIWQ